MVAVLVEGNDIERRPESNLETVECPRCHGAGEIGFNRSPINDPQCAEEATCNVCHGEGVVRPNERKDSPCGDSAS